MSFDEQAKDWDTKERIERSMILAEKISKNLYEKSEIKALEIGCGTGLIAMNLKDKLEVIHCIDESSEMIKVLQNKIDTFHITNIYTHDVDFLQDDSYYNQFDVIFSSMVFHHIADIREELTLLVKFLKEDGMMIIIDLDKEDGTFHKHVKDYKGHNGLDRQELRETCNDVGLAQVKIQTVYEDQKYVDDLPNKYSLFMCVAQREK